MINNILDTNRAFPVVISLIAMLITISGFGIAHAQSLPTGCAVGGSYNTSGGGFDNTTLDMNTTSVNSEGHIVLDTGASSLDPGNIVVPFKQAISTVFLFEASGYNSDLGWFVKQEAEQKLGRTINGTLPFSDLINADVTINYLFRTIKDDQETDGTGGGGNGVLDTFYDENDGLLGSSSGLTEAMLEAWGYIPNSSSIPGFVAEGEVDPRDMRKFVGNFEPGVEIVYFMHVDGDVSGKTIYSKDNWSGDVWNPFDSRKENNTLIFDHSIPAPESPGAPPTQYGPAPGYVPATEGFVPTVARDRMNNPDNKAAYPDNGYFNINLSGTISKDVVKGEKYNHFLLAAPPDDPFKSIFAVEDYPGGGSGDFNDLVFMVERKAGGVAQLKQTEALTPPDPSAYITSATIEVTDKMPCSGDTELKYLLSIDNGLNWVEASQWDIIKTPDKNGSDVTAWVFGSPEDTYRSTTINFSEIGLTGREMLWKTEIVSQDDTCIPEVISINLAYNAAVNQSFSRSAPIVMGNVIYSASFETPDASWTEKDLRGHFQSEQLYDPVHPDSGFDIADNWDAGSKLTADGPSRNMQTPEIVLAPVTGELVGQGDGASTLFTGTLPLGADEQIAHSTISITDGVESFVDKGTTDLEGSLTGIGTINRYTGKFSITFNTPPSNGVDILADFTKFAVKSNMATFSSSSVDKDQMALDNSRVVDITGPHYVYDFNSDDAFTEADATWLKNWTSGYADGSSTKKEWLLSAIDHSAPAIVGAPGIPYWYYGSGISDDARDSFDVYRCEQRYRKTYAYVGSRMGTLHAFYAGEYRPQYFDESSFTGGCDLGNLDAFKAAINPEACRDSDGNPTYPGPGVDCNDGDPGTMTINRGYYDWTDGSAPNYGDGTEQWAIIPADQLAKLKNNKMKNEDMAFVDASPSVAHVRFADGTWHTVIISAEGNGGDHIFALDITNEDAPGFLWEFADPDLFRSRSSPSVAITGQVTTSAGTKWVAFFVSGVNNSPTLFPSIYMVDIETGKVLDRTYLDSESLGIGGTPSGQPAVVDSDGDGYSDMLYIGTDKGYMYKITLSANPSSATVCTLFDASQPIFASPAVVIKNSINGQGTVDYRTLVFFGTGDSPFHVDSASDQYYFYAVEDTSSPGTCGAGTELWSYALPPGHRIFASAFATAQQVYFGTTSSDTDDPCAPPTAAASAAGEELGKIFALDVETAEVVHEEATGNITTTPVVVDEHLYVKTGSGSLHAYGGDKFDNKSSSGASAGSKPTVKLWREITQ